MTHAVVDHLPYPLGPEGERQQYPVSDTQTLTELAHCEFPRGGCVGHALSPSAESHDGQDDENGEDHHWGDEADPPESTGITHRARGEHEGNSAHDGEDRDDPCGDSARERLTCEGRGIGRTHRETLRIAGLRVRTRSLLRSSRSLIIGHAGFPFIIAGRRRRLPKSISRIEINGKFLPAQRSATPEARANGLREKLRHSHDDERDNEKNEKDDVRTQVEDNPQPVELPFRRLLLRS